MIGKLLEELLASGGSPSDAQLASLAGAPAEELDQAFRAFATAHGAAALPVVSRLAAPPADRAVRRAAKRALYRLSQRGLTPPPPPPRPVVARAAERATRAWLSGIDGSGSRASWILFEGGLGETSLCSLILNDTAGIVDVAGGAITRKRLGRELASLRASQKLPWVESDPPRAVGLVAEALALHQALGTAPPAGFGRWQRLFDGVPPAGLPAPVAEPDPALVDRAAELLELPELAGWFLDPEAVQSDALEREEARQSRLVVGDHIKAEREEAIVSRVVTRELGPDAARGRWGRRLAEMALVFTAIDRGEHAALAGAAAVALLEPGRDPAHHPFARALARRALEVASEVSAGRLRASDVSRKAPEPAHPRSDPASPPPLQ